MAKAHKAAAMRRKGVGPKVADKIAGIKPKTPKKK